MKRHCENTQNCICSKNPCKNTTMSQARQKGAGKTPHFFQLVYCWEVFWNPRSMSMSKGRQVSSNLWMTCGDVTRSKNSKRVRYILNVSYHTVFLHKMLAPHRQPTFRDSRWTKYSNPGQLYPPRPPNFKVVFFFQGWDGWTKQIKPHSMTGHAHVL